MKLLRYFLFLVCAVQFFFAIAFFLQLPFVIGLWPFPGTTPLTFIFFSSFFAAAAASTLWASASGIDGALAGIGLDYLAIFAPATILAFRLGTDGNDSRMIIFGFECMLGAFFGLGLFLWSVRLPIVSALPMPGLVRWSFALFILALLFAGGRLILKMPNTIPWTITPELSVLMGWMFIGAAVYFAYGLLRPSWQNAAGQLAGFLAYDLVLIVPFLNRLPVVPTEQKLSLILYILVLIYSGAVAIYYLFLRRPAKSISSIPSPGL
jgi:hypothetical protein